MTNEEFKKICMSQFDHCYHIMTDRGEQYGRKGDRLAQFKDVALTRNTTPEDALMGMRAKHESSLEYMVRDLAEGRCASLIQWQEKITDSINYLLLLKALICERMPVVPATMGGPLSKETKQALLDAFKNPTPGQMIPVKEHEIPAIIEQLQESELNTVERVLPRPTASKLTEINPVEPPESWNKPFRFDEGDGSGD